MLIHRECYLLQEEGDLEEVGPDREPVVPSWCYCSVFVVFSKRFHNVIVVQEHERTCTRPSL
jgi:hypothetical protein